MASEKIEHQRGWGFLVYKKILPLKSLFSKQFSMFVNQMDINKGNREINYYHKGNTLKNHEQARKI